MASSSNPNINSVASGSDAGASSASASMNNPSATAGEETLRHTPVCLVLGMAGSGKTTLVDALSSYLEDEEELSAAMDEMNINEQPGSATENLPGEGAYVINLDPAVYEIPYEPNIDIRDTVKYKDVMREYSLGPNGAIITSLNLYATRFDQVLSLLEKRSEDVKAVLVDTPGQIETFTWSASGTIITDALGMIFPTVVLFVVDTQRCQSAMTFVSNMLYACSIMYKTRLPMVIAFNKVDVVGCEIAQAWMRDFDEFDKALKEENFVGTLARSMAQGLEEFYNTMTSVGVSANTGEGLGDLVKAIKEACQEYEKEYRPTVEEKKKRRSNEERSRIEKQLKEFRNDAKDEMVNSDNEKNDSNEIEMDGETLRLNKMKGTHYDDEKEMEMYHEFLQKFQAKKQGQ